MITIIVNHCYEARQLIAKHPEFWLERVGSNTYSVKAKAGLKPGFDYWIRKVYDNIRIRNKYFGLRGSIDSRRDQRYADAMNAWYRITAPKQQWTLHFYHHNSCSPLRDCWNATHFFPDITSLKAEELSDADGTTYLYGLPCVVRVKSGNIKESHCRNNNSHGDSKVGGRDNVRSGGGINNTRNRAYGNSSVDQQVLDECSSDSVSNSTEVGSSAVWRATTLHPMEQIVQTPRSNTKRSRATIMPESPGDHQPMLMYKRYCYSDMRQSYSTVLLDRLNIYSKKHSKVNCRTKTDLASGNSAMPLSEQGSCPDNHPIRLEKVTRRDCPATSTSSQQLKQRPRQQQQREGET